MEKSSICSFKVIFCTIIFINIVYFIYHYRLVENVTDVLTKTSSNIKDVFIIDTPGCRIENLDVYNPEIIDLLYKVKNISCSSNKILTYIKKEGDHFTLNINKSLLAEYSLFEIHCCYSTVTRHPVGPNPDDNLILSDCRHFYNSIVIKENVVKVECSHFFFKVYENVHSIIRIPKTVSNKDDPNILLIGIDGVSRSNFIRTMPKTFHFCEKNGWISLKGYNKIEDNTFPNLMAVLTGMEFSYASKVCNPHDTEKLNNCSFIWNYFNKNNYSTAYAEDTPDIATFNHNKAGFRIPPTDYYFRPYYLVANQLSPKYLCLKAHCTGPEKTGIRMQNIIKNFLSSLKNVAPGFGLFWMNSFSHEDINCPSSMDEDFSDFFEDIQRRGYLDNTIIVFFSDHGFRFGKIRLTHTGWMEERLPFIYIWIPEMFRKSHKQEYTNLQENSKKLTTPYHIHMTLHHILSLSNKNFTEISSQGCPLCQSLFKNISTNATCRQSGIPDHYCSCSEYETVSKHQPLIKQVAEYLVTKVNEIISSYGKESEGCSKYRLDKITHAQTKVISADLEENVLVGVHLDPDANFEATVKVIKNKKLTYSLLSINRLDRYAPKTFCVYNSPVEMYCYCKSSLKRLTDIFCNNKFCFLYYLF